VIRLRQQHWMFAFVLALVTHLAAYLYSIKLPGSEPVYRGGGTFDQDDKLTPSAAGVLVQLGNSGESSGNKAGRAALKEQASTQRTRESLAQGFVAGAGKPGSGAKETEPAEIPEPTGKRVLEQTPSVPMKEVGPALEEVKEAKKPKSKVAAVPAPRLKPRRPNLMPEIETLGRRLSVQGPAETPRPPTRANPSRSEAAREGAKTGAGKSKTDEKISKGLAFANRQVGTASGNRSGEVRELNYEDQVLLWIKRHGAYPYDAAMYRLEDTVTLKFAINRQGKILYYKLIKRSKWDLLNRAVKRMMDRSSPVPPIPPEIGKKEITFTVPVRFELLSRP
jgi:protein TonB